jgi:hypothetical protein
MPHVSGFDAAADEIVMGRFDVGDDERTLGGAGRGRRDSLAECD